jgi:hypothetical protein
MSKYALAGVGLALGIITQPPVNLLHNPSASLSFDGWRADGDAQVEQIEGNPIFVVRNHGSFHQLVVLPGDSAGKFVVFLGLGSSERINSDGTITGLPYLYGLMANADGTRFLAHLQGQGMRATPVEPNTWVKMWGVFRIPSGTAQVWFSLNQAERSGVPQNGSAARFDDLGFYLFSAEDDAKAFVAAWLRKGAA